MDGEHRGFEGVFQGGWISSEEYKDDGVAGEADSEDKNLESESENGEVGDEVESGKKGGETEKDIRAEKETEVEEESEKDRKKKKEMEIQKWQSSLKVEQFYFFS